MHRVDAYHADKNNDLRRIARNQKLERMEIDKPFESSLKSFRSDFFKNYNKRYMEIIGYERN